MAAVKTGSPKISFQRSNDRLVVMIVDLRPQRSDRWLNNSSAPSLSKEIYPNSSQITRSNFSNRFSRARSNFWERLSLIWVNRRATVVNNTLYPCWQASMPSAVARCVFPVPGLPDRMMFWPELIKSSRSRTPSLEAASSGRSSRERSCRYLYWTKPAWRSWALRRF